MPFFSLRSLVRRIVILASYLLLVALVTLFALGGYRWAMQIGRVPALSINPVMYPLFSQINVSVVEGNVEPFYRLYRTYDYYAEDYTSARTTGPLFRVPVVYVHGNAGSYSCARSLARFLYEANANLRVSAHKNFLSDTRNRVVDVMQADNSWRALKGGQLVPQHIQQQAEAFVVRTSHPILAAELFTVDFAEESFTQSGVLTMKSARFINHSLHVLMHEFLRAHAATIRAPVTSVFDAKSVLGEALTPTATDATLSGSATKDERDGEVIEVHEDASTGGAPPIADTLYTDVLQAHRQEVRRNKALRKVSEEYKASLCDHRSRHSRGAVYCDQAKQHLERFSVQERVREEVQRTRENGLWIWGESLGGTLGILAAVLSPDLVAGVVLVASPVHYQPLFFDVASTWLFRTISDAARRPSLLLSGAPTLTENDWKTKVLPDHSPVELIRKLSSVAPVELAARLDRVLLLAINGGALDDVIPSISGALQRSFPRLDSSRRRGAGSLKGLSRTELAPLMRRRDQSTELLRWCGWPMDHRGLVYSLQFLQATAGSLVSAALLPNATDYFYRDTLVPDDLDHTPGRARLFPNVVETLTGPGARHAEKRTFDAASLKLTSGGRLTKSSLLEELYEGFDEVCTSTPPSRPLDLNNFTVFDEADESGYYDGSKTLTVLLGYTTLPSDKIRSAVLKLYRDPAHTTLVDDVEATTELSTQMHLPVLQKGSEATPGLVLRTVFSFTPRRKIKRRLHPQHVYAEFCLLVDNRDTDLLAHHHTFVEGSHVSTAALYAERQPLFRGPFFVGNRLRVEPHHTYVLMDGVQSTTLEGDLHVTTHPSAAVYPFTMCGSLHSFYLALRGDGESVIGDPDAQLQLFFGAYEADTVNHEFHYQWKPFSTFGSTNNETYMCYTIGDNSVSAPTVEPRDLTALSRLSSSPLSLERTRDWWTRVWPSRWLAHFSVYTGIARCGASAVLLFFQLYMMFGWLRRRFCTNPQLLAEHNRGCLRSVSRTLTPLWALLVVALVMEVVSGAVADAGLRVCRDMTADPRLSDAQRTAQMGVVEKLTLLALWLTPNYQECQYSWIQVQAVPVWSNLAEHMATIYFGFVFAMILLVLVMVIVQLLSGVVGLPLAKLLVRPLVQRSTRAGAVLLLLLWAAPTVVLLVVPGMPLCYVELAAAVLAQTIIWSIPWTIAPGLHFWWPCVELCVASWFPAHFDGLVLTIRNHVVLREEPQLFWEPERYLLTTQQKIVFTCVQLGLAAVYCTVFCTIRAAHTLKTAKTHKKHADTDARKTDSTKTPTRPTENRGEYLLGNFGQRFPLWVRLTRVVRGASLVLSVWASIVASRRPLEGGVTLCGNVALLIYLVTFLTEYW